MQSLKNLTGTLSALSMAAAAAFAIRSAYAADLSLYYGQTSGTNNARSDGVYIGTETGIGTTSRGGVSNGGVAPANIALSQTAIADTISMAIGEYLSLSINAVLTGNQNPDRSIAETTNSTATVVQPNSMGLSALGIRIPSSDRSGAILQPLIVGSPYATYAGTPAYASTAKLNESQTTPGGPVAPSWFGSTFSGDVEQNDGSVSSNSQIFGGNTSANGLTSETLVLPFSSTASSAAYTNSTEFFNSLIYKADSYGTVTLTPYVDSSATQYWRLLTPATGGGQGANGGTLSRYQATFFTPSDTIGTLPLLVIEVPGPIGPTHSILTLGSSAPAPAYGSSSGTLTVSGHNGSYNLAEIAGLNDVTNYVEATGWNPASDEEIYGLDVLVNGNQASVGQLVTLINAIDGDGKAPASSGVTASTFNPGGAFAAGYDLFLTYAGGGPATTDFLGLDLSSSNDSNLIGYSFSAVAVVPEPMSLGILAVGGVGILGRRGRRGKT